MEIVTTTPLWAFLYLEVRHLELLLDRAMRVDAAAHRSGRPLRTRASKSGVTDRHMFLHKSARRARTACVSVRAHEGDALIERR